MAQGAVLNQKSEPQIALSVGANLSILPTLRWGTAARRRNLDQPDGASVRSR